MSPFLRLMRCGPPSNFRPCRRAPRPEVYARCLRTLQVRWGGLARTAQHRPDRAGLQMLPPVAETAPVPLHLRLQPRASDQQAACSLVIARHRHLHLLRRAQLHALSSFRHCLQLLSSPNPPEPSRRQCPLGPPISRPQRPAAMPLALAAAAANCLGRRRRADARRASDLRECVDRIYANAPARARFRDPVGGLARPQQGARGERSGPGRIERCPCRGSAGLCA